MGSYWRRTAFADHRDWHPPMVLPHSSDGYILPEVKIPPELKELMRKSDESTMAALRCPAPPAPMPLIKQLLEDAYEKVKEQHREDFGRHPRAANSTDGPEVALQGLTKQLVELQLEINEAYRESSIRRNSPAPADLDAPPNPRNRYRIAIACPFCGKVETWDMRDPPCGRDWVEEWCFRGCKEQFRFTWDVVKEYSIQWQVQIFTDYKMPEPGPPAASVGEIPTEAQRAVGRGWCSARCAWEKQLDKWRGEIPRATAKPVWDYEAWRQNER